jgi:protein SCO1/2
MTNDLRRSNKFGRSPMRLKVLLLALFIFCAGAGRVAAAESYSVTGVVLKVDKAKKSFTASCQQIPGYMDAMVMPYSVRESRELEGLAPGTMIEFNLVVDQESSYAKDVRIRGYDSLEQDPLTARRLRLLNGHGDSPQEKPLDVGQQVPDFALLDQNGQRVALSQFAGKVVAITFIYTRCALPNFCFRLSNNFGRLQKRFGDRMGQDLVLLSISFDPVHDQPDVLAHYGSIWNADPKGWRLLTGSLPEVQRVSHLFGMNFWLDEGLMTHSLHTIVIDRNGKLVANLEGNEFTADQLGDLVQTEMNRSRPRFTLSEWIARVWHAGE